MTSDNVHPNAYGNQIIADNWFGAIRSATGVPEPSGLALVAVCGYFLCRRRAVRTC